MRTIKFRGKLVDTQEWTFGSLVKCHNGRMGIVSMTKYCEDNGIEALIDEVLPETVGQYTGIKDVHGVDIYEGDILVGHSDKKYIVMFNEYGSFYTVPIEPHTTQEELLLWFRVEDEHTPVIGNIHDNPELLKGGEE